MKYTVCIIHTNISIGDIKHRSPGCDFSQGRDANVFCLLDSSQVKRIFRNPSYFVLKSTYMYLMKVSNNAYNCLMTPFYLNKIAVASREELEVSLSTDDLVKVFQCSAETPFYFFQLLLDPSVECNRFGILPNTNQRIPVSP